VRYARTHKYVAASEGPQDNRQLFFARASPTATEADMYQLFAAHGEVSQQQQRAWWEERGGRVGEQRFVQQRRHQGGTHHQHTLCRQHPGTCLNQQQQLGTMVCSVGARGPGGTVMKQPLHQGMGGVAVRPCLCGA
jgi:hypothetical protein